MARAQVRVELNRQGIRELLRSREIQAEMKRQADRLAARVEAPAEYHHASLEVKTDSFVGKNRATARVILEGEAANVYEANHGALRKAIDGGVVE